MPWRSNHLGFGRTAVALLALIVFVATSHAELYVIAHIPYGGGWVSRIFFSNPSIKQVRVEMKYFSQDGQAISVPVSSQDGRSADRVDIEPNGTKTLDTDALARNSALRIAWAVASTSAPLQLISTTAPLQILTLFDQGFPSTLPSGALGPVRINTAAGATSDLARRVFYFPISVHGAQRYDAGVAIANPQERIATIRLIILEADGRERASRVIQLPAGSQITTLLTDPRLFEGSFDPSRLFNGAVAVCSDTPVGIVALGFESDLVYTLPVSNAYRCPGT